MKNVRMQMKRKLTNDPIYFIATFSKDVPQEDDWKKYLPEGRVGWAERCPDEKCGSIDVRTTKAEGYVNLMRLECGHCGKRWTRVHSSSLNPFPEKVEA